MASSSWDPATYDTAWSAMAAQGKDPHGEVAFVERLLVRTAAPAGAVLDAGCGTGRVAIELANRGHDVDGTDVDAAMLGHAATKAPAIEWHRGNLARIELPRRYRTVVMAGNVILFVEHADRADVLANVARHLEPGGLLVAGFQLARPDGRRVTLAEWDAWSEAAGLVLLERHATWDEDPFHDRADYAVSVHRRSA